MNLSEKKIDSELKYSGVIVNVMLDHAELCDGSIVKREVVEHPGGVTVLPIDDDGFCYCVRQFRYPMGKVLAKEMKDRFGPLPKSALRMVRLALLRVKAAQSGIGIIDVKEKRAILYRNGSRDIVKVLDLRGKNADRKIYELMNQI